MKSPKITLFFLIYPVFLSGLFAQSTDAVSNQELTTEERKLTINLDLVSRYLWRGQCWGGDYVAVQPTIDYAITEKLTVGTWATTNFKKDYFYPDGETSYKGYQELDFNIRYQLFPFLSVQLWDYYWPTVSPVEGIDNSYFNYSSNGVKTVDAMLYFDFSEYKIPINATISTLVAGNDFRLDDQGENPKQNYTTYVELGYSFEELIKTISLNLNAGVVLNNQAAYYTSGDYDKPSLVNLNARISREVNLTKRLIMPLSLSYIHNAATKNTEVFGRNFIVAGLTLNYN